MLSLFNKLSGELFILNGIEGISCAWNLGKSCYFNRHRRSCRINFIALMIRHNSNLADRRARNYYVSRMKRSVLHQKRSDRSSSLVESCFYNGALSKPVWISLKLLHFCYEKYVLKQFFNAVSRFCRNRNAHNVSAPFLNDKTVFSQLLLDSVYIGSFFVHLIDSYYYRYVGRFRMIYRFNCLRHNAVVGGNYKDSDICNVRASGSH